MDVVWLWVAFGTIAFLLVCAIAVIIVLARLYRRQRGAVLASQGRNEHTVKQLRELLREAGQ